MFLFSISLLLTLVVTYIKLPKLKNNPYSFKDWALVALPVISMAVSIYMEYDKKESEKKRQAANANYGVLIPGKAKDSLIVWEIGNKPFFFQKNNFDVESIVFNWPTIENPNAKLKPFDGIKFKAEIEKGKIYITTTLRDTSGNIIAEMTKNEWQVNRPQFAYDRNYNDTSLEIKDNFGDIVFQIEIVLGRIIRMNAKFIKPDGQLLITFPIRKSLDVLGRISCIVNFESGHYKWASSQKFSQFYPLFKYPSSFHQGERNSLPNQEDYNQILFDNMPEYPKDIKDSNKTYLIIN